MTHFKWLKKEIPRWVKEEIITREAGDSLISLYRNEERHSHGEGLFVLAAVCFLTGLIFICAGVWNGLSQDEQFMMALVPLVLSILIIAAILWQDRPVMDQIPAESVRLEEAENTAELLSGETGGTVSAGSGSEENTAAGNKGKDLSSLLPSVSYRHRVPDVIREAAGVFHGVAVLCAVWMVNESFKLSGDLVYSCGGVLRIPSSDELGVSCSRSWHGVYGIVSSCIPFIAIPGMAGSGGVDISCFGASPSGAALGRTAS